MQVNKKKKKNWKAPRIPTKMKFLFLYTCPRAKKKSKFPYYKTKKAYTFHQKQQHMHIHICVDIITYIHTTSTQQRVWKRGGERELDHKSRERKRGYWKRSQKTEPNSTRKRNLHHPPTVFDDTTNNALPISLLLLPLFPLPLHSLPLYHLPLTLSVSDSERKKEKEKERFQDLYKKSHKNGPWRAGSFKSKGKIVE